MSDNDHTGAEMFTMTGWVWMTLHSQLYDEETGEPGTDPVEGFSLWTAISARLRVHPQEFKSSAYTSFKNSLRELDSLGAIKRCGPAGERKLARILWLPTEQGQKWWDSVGLDEHGPDRPRDGRTGIATPPPMKKWIRVAASNGPTRRLIERKIFSGEWEVAFREAE